MKNFIATYTDWGGNILIVQAENLEQAIQKFKDYQAEMNLEYGFGFIKDFTVSELSLSDEVNNLGYFGE